MKKKKVAGKKKKANKKTKLIIIATIVLCFGIAGFIYYKTNNTYYNNYASKCSSGYYYFNSIFGIFGRGCRECPAGQYCPGNDRRYVCERGHYCVKGTKSKCPIGTYQDQEGQSSCKKCSTDGSKTTKQTGSASPDQCISSPTSETVTCASDQYKSNNKCYDCPKCNGNVKCFVGGYGATSVKFCHGTVPAGKYIICNSSGCTVKGCTGNTYSNAKSVYYSSSLKTSCTACSKGKKANSTHTGCV